MDDQLPLVVGNADDTLPFVGDALLKHLRARFPDRAPRPSDLAANPHAAIQRAAEQTVIDHIAELHATQNERTR